MFHSWVRTSRQIIHEIKYNIVKNIGMLFKSAPALPSRTGVALLAARTVSTVEGSGWAKEVNLISWNDRDAKYDTRHWSPDREKMGKGVTLSTEELSALKVLLNTMEL